MAAVGDSATQTSMDMSGGKTAAKHVAGEKAGHQKAAGEKAGHQTAADPARLAWAHKYGMDRSTMPRQPDVSSASAQQQTAATDLLVRTQAATAKYADLATARAAGYDLQASLAKAEKKKPGLADALKKADAGMPAMDGQMKMLHVGNTANKADGKVLDPSAPETLMYGYAGNGHWKLMGVMYTARESYPQAPPDPGGPITRWHYHSKHGGVALMMHIFFVPGNDLGSAYATELG